jgi:rhamnosyltransferase
MNATPLPPLVSVVILTKNGCPDVAHCLAAVFDQNTEWPYEVIIIDSGSTDNTLGVVSQYPVRLIEIPPQSFNHGATRNLGAEQARGEFVAFLTQDAIPADKYWLSALVAPFDKAAVAGAFSRQLPKADAHALTRRQLALWVGGRDQRLFKRMPTPSTYARMSPMERYELAVFDDVSSCLRRSVWEELPYAELPFGEDIDWAQRALEAGYALAYEPASRVHHSHNRSPIYEFKRIYLDHINLYRLFGLETVPTLRAALNGLIRGWGGYSQYVLQSGASLGEKLRLLFTYIPFIVPAQVFGQYLGRHAGEFRARWGWFRRLDQTLQLGV